MKKRHKVTSSKVTYAPEPKAKKAKAEPKPRAEPRAKAKPAAKPTDNKAKATKEARDAKAKEAAADAAWEEVKRAAADAAAKKDKYKAAAASFKTPKDQKTQPKTTSKTTVVKKAKKGGFKKGQRVQATYDKGDPKWYGAKVVGVHWSDSLETLIGVDLKYDDGAFWNNAPVYAIKCLA